MPVQIPNIKMNIFPLTDVENGIGGAVVDSGGFHTPTATDIPLIYLNANPDVQLILDKVAAASGTFIVPKTPIGDAFGNMAIVIDTEGSRIGLQSI